MKKVMVETNRMNIYPLSLDRMDEVIKNEPDEEMKKAYGEMKEGCEKHPEQYVWYAIWYMELKEGNIPVGDLCFKGLEENESVEIGYGIKPEFEGQGLTTEAVVAMCQWAIKQEGVNCIEAETDPDNRASQRVLEKAGFLPNGVIGEEGPRFVWRG